MTRILVIEDQPQMRRNIATILEMEGFRVFAAQNGSEGIAVAARERPDVILCDVMMPELDGYGVLQALRKDAITALIPFIFLTAKSDRADLRAGMNLGADDYLTKPVGREELLEAVKARLKRRDARKKSIRGAHPDFSSPEPLRKLGLTAREAEVLLGVAQGKSNADVAAHLGMAEKTVKKHLTHIFEKLGVESRHAATLHALELLCA
jgi:DNA-binding NarL/FixJ family response regulator